MEVRPTEVGTGGRFSNPPLGPTIDALQEKFEMLWVGH